MTREQRIVETFVELADTMVDDFDVVEFLHRLVEHSLELLDCAETGLLLAGAAGRLQVMASSSERSEALELLQSQNEEGPCFECYKGSTAGASARISRADIRALADVRPDRACRTGSARCTRSRCGCAVRRSAR